MRKIQFKLAAMTNMGLVRKNNEDNYHVVSNVSDKSNSWSPNELIDLDERGMLLVVADGMGGMNAGEVASEIAIETVKECFTPENIPLELICNKKSIDKFMKDTIVRADNQIKATSRQRPETKGMGTTIVMAWIIDGYMYVAWCGDSRAYVYNPAYGIIRVSKDHSYVQSLVDQGKLTDDEAFDFPDSNVITNCLCDASNVKAEPECLPNAYELHNNDIILLCSDGLCGMVRDYQIEGVVTRQQDNMLMLADNLVDAALKATGADNVTVTLAKIISGCKQIADPVQDAQPHGNGLQKTQMSGVVPSSNVAGRQEGGSRSWIWIACIAAVVACVVCAFLFWPDSKGGQEPVAQSDNGYKVFRDHLLGLNSSNAIIIQFNSEFLSYRDNIKNDDELIKKVADASTNNRDMSQKASSYETYEKLAALMRENGKLDDAICYWGRMCELDRDSFLRYMNESLKNALSYNEWDKLQNADFVVRYYSKIDTNPGKDNRGQNGTRNGNKGKDGRTGAKNGEVQGNDKESETETVKDENQSVTQENIATEAEVKDEKAEAEEVESKKEPAKENKKDQSGSENIKPDKGLTKKNK